MICTSLKQILAFPLWVLIFAGILTPSPTVTDGAGIGLYVIALCDFINALPAPTNRIQDWMYRKVKRWAEQQRRAAVTLLSLNVLAVGSLEK